MRLTLSLLVLSVFLFPRAARADASTGAPSCPAKGISAPAFSFPLARGGRTSLHDLLAKHRPVVVSFWSTTCGPCKVELPQLDKLSREWGEKVSVVTVHVGAASREHDDLDTTSAEVLAFFDAQQIGLPAAIDSNAKVSKEHWCVSGLPRLFVLDEEGRVAADLQTAQTDFESSLRAVVAPLLR